MKYAQLIMGLLIGTALGGAVVASQGKGLAIGGGVDSEQVKSIVRETISEEGKLILDSVQKYQQNQQKNAQDTASEALKGDDVKDALYNDEDVAFAGPKNAKKVVVEFFDYDCPVCKVQFKSLQQLLAKDKDVKVIFHEFPIFGEQSVANAKIGLAVFNLYPEKYVDFHAGMAEHQGHSDKNTAIGVVKKIGLNAAKVQAKADSAEIGKVLDDARALGAKLSLQGTPAVVIGDALIPHAVDINEIESRLNGKAE